jgi:hypothetical protein
VDVPYDPAATGTSTPPPTQGKSTPQASGFFYDNAAVSTGGLTGELTLHVAATASIAASGSFPGYTPNASPYGFYQSVNGGQTWTQLGSFQSGTSKVLTGLDLNTPLLFSARYRDNSATPLRGDFAVPAEVVISTVATTVDLDGVKNGSSTRTSGQIVWTWDSQPAKAVDYFKVWMGPLSAAIDTNRAPDWQGAGTTSGGRVSTPAFTGLSDQVDYHAIVREGRT